MLLRILTSFRPQLPAAISRKPKMGGPIPRRQPALAHGAGTHKARGTTGLRHRRGRSRREPESGPLPVALPRQFIVARRDASYVIDPTPVISMYPLTGSNHPTSSIVPVAPENRPVPPVMINISANVVSPVMTPS